MGSLCISYHYRRRGILAFLWNCFRSHRIRCKQMCSIRRGACYNRISCVQLCNFLVPAPRSSSLVLLLYYAREKKIKTKTARRISEPLIYAAEVRMTSRANRVELAICPGTPSLGVSHAKCKRPSGWPHPLYGPWFYGATVTQQAPSCHRCFHQFVAHLSYRTGSNILNFLLGGLLRGLPNVARYELFSTWNKR